MFKQNETLRDPPSALESKIKKEQKRSLIKKIIRENLEKNQLLSKVLKKNHATGKFIKELSKELERKPIHKTIISLESEISFKLNDIEPINGCIFWGKTSQGFGYWEKINRDYRELKKIQNYQTIKVFLK